MEDARDRRESDPAVWTVSWSPARVALVALAALFLAAPAGAAAGVRTEPVIPPLTDEVGERVSEIAAAGAALGNRANVFAKVGDSITSSDFFLYDLACGEPAWGRWTSLAATRDYFASQTFPAAYTDVRCERSNSFSRESATAVSGWDAGDALARFADPPRACRRLTALACEYRLLRPAVALIMYGTNDVESFTPPAYRANLAELVEQTVEAGVIPVLSTIPPRLDKRRRNQLVKAFNRRVIGVAREYRIPLWNYWRSLQGERIVHSGVSTDGIHPNLFGRCESSIGCAYDFTAKGLRYGYNQRNLGALRVLERIRTALSVGRGRDPAYLLSDAKSRPGGREQ